MGTAPPWGRGVAINSIRLIVIAYYKILRNINGEISFNINYQKTSNKTVNALSMMNTTAHDKCGWRNQLIILLVTTIGCNFTVR